MPTIDKFRDYLLADLPEEYPISSIPMSLTMTDAHRKELIFQQSKFLGAAEKRIEEQPWVAFLGAAKHLRLLDYFETNTTNFRELADKEYFDKVQHKCSEILAAASSSLDEETKSNCEKLVHIQVLHRDIASAAEAVKNALSNRIRSFEPPMSAPEQTPGCGGCLVVIVGGILVGAVASAASEDMGPFIGAFALIVGGGIWAQIMKPKWDKEKADKARYKVFESFRSAYYLHANKLKTDLSFPVESLASDLSTCATHLDNFLSDLEILKDTYIKPYV